MLVLTLIMLVIVALAALVVTFVAFPHRGEEVPTPPGSATRWRGPPRPRPRCPPRATSPGTTTAASRCAVGSRDAASGRTS